MADTIKVRCKCGKSYRVPLHLQGEKARCPNAECRNRFRIPVITSCAGRVAPAPRRRARACAAPRRTNRWLAGLLILGVVFVGSGMTVATTAWGWGSGNMLAAVPADMDLVLKLKLGESLDQLGLEQEIGKQLRQQLGGLELDAGEDLHEVLVALGTSGEGAEPRVLILVRGQLDLKTVLPQLGREVSFSEQSYRGYRMFQVRHANLPEPMSVALLSADLIALGDEATVKQAIECLTDQVPSIEQDSQMAELIEQTGPSDLFWCVARTPKALEESLPAEIQGLDGLLVRVGQQDKRFELEAVAKFDSRGNAATAQSTLKQGLDQLDGLFSQSRPASVDVELDELLVGSRVERTGSRVSLRLSISSDASSELLGQGLRGF